MFFVIKKKKNNLPPNMELNMFHFHPNFGMANCLKPQPH